MTTDDPRADRRYSFFEAGRLLGVSPSTVKRWLDVEGVKVPAGEPVVSFNDLVELRIADCLHQVSGRRIDTIRPHLRRAAEKSGSRIETLKFAVDATKDLWWVDGPEGARKWESLFGEGQQGIDPVLTVISTSVETDAEGMASRLSLDDSRRVVVDPRRQWGRPTLAGTRVLTTTLYAYWLGSNQDEERVAEDFDVSPEDVRAAVAFEQSRRRSRAA